MDTKKTQDSKRITGTWSFNDGGARVTITTYSDGTETRSEQRADARAIMAGFTAYCASRTSIMEPVDL